jgi:hypothetical protein
LLAPALSPKLTFRFLTTSATSKIKDGGFGGFAAVFSSCLPSQGKSPPLRSGWLLFFSPDYALFALFASFSFFFCFAIVIVCAPNPIFLSFFTLFLVACWLLLIRWLQISGGFIPWLQSLAALLLGPFLGLGGPWFGLASVLLPGSSPSPWCSARNRWHRLCSPPWLLSLESVFLLGSSPWPHGIFVVFVVKSSFSPAELG